MATPFSGAGHGIDRRHPTFRPCPLGNLVLDPLDGHRIGVDPEHARPFTRGRAQTSGEVGKVVGGMQPLDRLRPVAPVDQVVPLGNQVPKRAALVAKRNPTVHAPGSLMLSIFDRKRLIDLFPVAQPHVHRAAAGKLPVELQESGDITHGTPPSPLRLSSDLRPPPSPLPRAPGGSPSASP